jgi:hypothetical protein
VTISGAMGDHAKNYQERAVKAAIEESKEWKAETGTPESLPDGTPEVRVHYAPS